MYPNLAPYQKRIKSTKDQVINVLSYDWPLSARQIYSMLKRQYKVNITYQAAYKAISEMTGEKILEKTSKGYHLNLDWVKDIHDQTEIIRVNYYSEQRAFLTDTKTKESSIRVFTFKTWFDAEKYLYYLQKNYILRAKEKQIICFHHDHEWRPLFYLRAEYNWIKKLQELGHKTFILCSGNYPIDKWAAQIYKSFGAKVKLSAKCADTNEVMIFSDLVIQIYIPEDLKMQLRALWKTIKHPDQLDIEFLIKNVFEKKAELKVVINKDVRIANQIKAQTLKYFR